MTKSLFISVIIPVYNAVDYVEKAVTSALNQPKVREVLLIEDGSPDGCLEVCRKLNKKYSNVRLFQHPGGENLGPSASRNLGIRNASCEYIAFLDADDYYLPNRFSNAIRILNNMPEIDGVYEAVGTAFEDNYSQSLFNNTLILEEMMTTNRTIQPGKLFESFMLGDAGSEFHLNGFTCRRRVFSTLKIFFSEDMRLHQDTLLIYQLSAKAVLVSGQLENPVAIQRIHPNNRITHHLENKRAAYLSRNILYSKLLSWGRRNLKADLVTLIILKYLNHLRTINQFNEVSIRDFIFSRYQMLRLIVSNFPIFLDLNFWKKLASKKVIKKIISKLIS